VIHIDEMDFHNNDIKHLAIYLAEAWRPRSAELANAAIVNGQAVAYNGFGVLLGYSLLNTDAAVANTVRLVDSTDPVGPLLAAESLAISGAVTRWFGPSGLHIKRGLTVVGTTTGTAVLYLLPHRVHD
jgi:hypothetical protein